MKHTITALFLFALLTLSGCDHHFLDDDYWDDDRYNGGSSRNPVTVTVAEAKNLRDDVNVILTGTIQKALYHEKYEFSDSTGTVTLDIDYDVWRRSALDPYAVPLSAEIRGEIDQERSYMEIDVDRITKL